MTYEEVLKYFNKTPYKLCIDNGMSKNTAYHWKKLGYIPIETQIRLERLTKGGLKANLNDDWSIKAHE